MVNKIKKLRRVVKELSKLALEIGKFLAIVRMLLEIFQ